MNKFQVLIIHEDSLVSLGIQKILIDMFNIKHITYSSSFIAQNFDDYNIIFTSILHYALNNESFITNKHKTVIVGKNISYQNLNENIIEELWTEEHIINKINDIISKLSDIKSTHNELSKREIDVLKLIARGHINKEIADILHISFNTVLTHRKNITAKLGIKSVSGLSVYAMMNGYITSK